MLIFQVPRWLICNFIYSILLFRFTQIFSPVIFLLSRRCISSFLEWLLLCGIPTSVNRFCLFHNQFELVVQISPASSALPGLCTLSFLQELYGPMSCIFCCACRWKLREKMKYLRFWGYKDAEMNEIAHTWQTYWKGSRTEVRANLYLSFCQNAAFWISSFKPFNLYLHLSFSLHTSQVRTRDKGLRTTGTASGKQLANSSGPPTCAREMKQSVDWVESRSDWDYLRSARSNPAEWIGKS